MRIRKVVIFWLLVVWAGIAAAQTPTPNQTFRLVLNDPNFTNIDGVRAWAAEFKRRLTLALFCRAPQFCGTGGGSGSVTFEQNGSVVVSGGSLNVVEPDGTVLTESPVGTARLDLSGYVRLDGRAGGQEVFGGSASGEDLILKSNIVDPQTGIIGIGDETQMFVDFNAFFEPRLNLGTGIDPSTILFAGGISPVSITTAVPVISYWGLDGQGGLMYALTSRGTYATPASSLPGDTAFQYLVSGIDLDGNSQEVGKWNFQLDQVYSGYISGALEVILRSNNDTTEIVEYCKTVAAGDPACTFGGIWGGPPSLLGTLTTMGNLGLSIIGQADVVQERIHGDAGQTANLTEWRDSSENTLSGVDANGLYLPASSTDAAAPNNSLYYSTDASKLVYKDGGGTVNNLY